jgi:hypothetical protein
MMERRQFFAALPWAGRRFHACRARAASRCRACRRRVNAAAYGRPGHLCDRRRHDAPRQSEYTATCRSASEFLTSASTFPS